jgi:hypothetical protein
MIMLTETREITPPYMWMHCTGGAYRPFLHDPHFSAASSFQTAYREDDV